MRRRIAQAGVRGLETRGALRGKRGVCAFTLLELLVTISILALLMGVLLPALSRSRHEAKLTACRAGLQQIGVAIGAYTVESGGYLPYGPKSPPPSATNFYPLTGNVTSLISLQNGSPVGLGLLLADYLNAKKDILFCPGADVTWDTQESLAAVGKAQVESSYYYRHASVSSLSGPLPVPRMDAGRLGKNRKGEPIRCLVMDSQFVAPAAMAVFNLATRTHHRQEMINALHVDGHISSHSNTDDRYTVNLSLSVYQTLDRILEIFESLDGA